MRKSILEGIAGIGLLAVIPACGTQMEPVANINAYETARQIQVNPELVKENQQLSRNVSIPQLQIDAQSVYRRMITYITPDEELLPTVSADKLAAYIDFPAGAIQINAKYGNNRAELAKLEERLKSMLQLTNGKIRKIRITGYASPDGNTKENERLAGNRAIQFKNYLQKQFSISDGSLISVDWVGEDWEGLRQQIAGSDKKYSSRVMAIFQLTDDPDSRRKQIKAIDNGAVYKDIEKSFFARLRRMELTVETETELAANGNPALVDMIYNHPGKVSLQDFFRVAAFYRPGTEQYREIYELAAYTHPSCKVAQLNAAAASLALGDKESARYFLEQTDNDPRSYNNRGVLALMEGDKEKAIDCFRKYFPQNPRVARENLSYLVGE